MAENKYIPGYGNIGAKIMIVFECPTYEDTLAGKLFSKPGETGRLLTEAGINPNECWITSVSKYWVPSNEARSKKKIPFAVRAKTQGVDLQENIYALQNEVNTLQPNIILGIGKTALWAFTGHTDITAYRGSILSGMGRKFVATYNPSHLSWQAADVEFIGYYNRQIMAFDMRRAKDQSRFPDIKRPSRTLQVAKSSYELYEFRERYKDSKRMSVDIEANG